MTSNFCTLLPLSISDVLTGELERRDAPPHYYVQKFNKVDHGDGNLASFFSVDQTFLLYFIFFVIFVRIVVKSLLPK